MSTDILVIVGDLGARTTVAARQWAHALADALAMPVGYIRADPSIVLTALATADVRTNANTLSPEDAGGGYPLALRFRADGGPDWLATCSKLPALAVFGGPPVRLAAPLEHDADERRLADDWDPVAEVRRGIFEVTGLYAETGERAGWLEVSCGSSRMAAWMAACLVLEGIEAYCDAGRLGVPAAPSFTLHEDVRDLLVGVAKAHRHWTLLALP